MPSKADLDEDDGALMLGRSGFLPIAEFAALIALGLILLGIWSFISSGEASGLMIAGMGLLILSFRVYSAQKYIGFVGVLLVIVGMLLSLGW